MARLNMPNLRRLTIGQVITYALTTVIVLGLVLDLILVAADGPSSVIFLVLVTQLVGFIVLLVTYSKSFVRYGPLGKVLIPLISGLSLLVTFVYVTG